MNDTAGNTASSLAITEKRPHRPGGCVGIFFQLFDWNRMFAKKKLFSKKLLPSAHQKEAPRKLGGDNKLPKLRLIANKNCGGFPNVKKNGASKINHCQKPMRSPSLVARLMGLESMPAVQINEPKKASFFETGSDEEAKSLSSHIGFDKEDPSFEKGRPKHELRPQKIQKTGSFERLPLRRFGAEGLQFKSVLSRSRKHQSKLASPVKNPSMTSGRNTARLIDAAARILEPGLQATNKAKCALLREQACKNCGSLLDFVNPSLNLEENPQSFASPVSNFVNPSLEGTERSRPGPPTSSLEQENERAQTRNNIRIQAKADVNRKPPNGGGQIQWHLTSQQSKPQKDVLSPIPFKHKAQRQNQVLPSSSNLHRNRVSYAANAINGTKDFVSLNRTLSSCARSSFPFKAGNCKCDYEGRKSCNKQDDSLSPVRKKRSANVNQRGENSGFVSSTFAKQRYVRREAMTTRRTRNVSEDNDVISFAFNSPMKQKIGIDITQKITQKNSVVGGSDRKMSSEKSFPLSGDVLGALLEKKLKEMTCQEQDEFKTGSNQAKRNTAMILQDLVSALTAKRAASHDDVAVVSYQEDVSCHSRNLLKPKLTFQAKETTSAVSRGYFHDINHLSPGSVLEASFSNDSCLSSSLDDNSGSNPHLDSMDSATSPNEDRNGLHFVTDLLSHVSGILYNIGFAYSRLTRTRLSHAEEVILNAELIFKNMNGSNDFSLTRFLIHELEALANTFVHFLIVDDTKNGNRRLKEFLFDCVIEYLDSRYSPYCISGFKTWTGMPSRMDDDDKLIGEVVDEITRWSCLAGKTGDEIIEREMSHSLGKWTDFEFEGYETGAEIERDLLQILVDEVVMDLHEVDRV